MSQFSNLSYGQVRLAWCRMALVNLIRRWGIYVLVGLLVLGGAGSSAVAAMTAFAAWSVLPLFQSALQPIGQAFLMTFGYALVGGMVVWGLSPICGLVAGQRPNVHCPLLNVSNASAI